MRETGTTCFRLLSRQKRLNPFPLLLSEFASTVRQSAHDQSLNTTSVEYPTFSSTFKTHPNVIKSFRAQQLQKKLQKDIDFSLNIFEGDCQFNGDGLLPQGLCKLFE